jgi:ferritin-like metal-binding protein YciE
MPHDTAGLIRYLQDAHAMEVGALEAVDAFNVGYATVEASTAVHNYRGICENQVRTLNTLLETLGARPSGTKNFVGALMGKAADWVNVNQDGENRATLLLVRIYGTAQTKGAMYDAVAAYADTMGDPEIVKIAREHGEQEFAAAEVLFPFIWDSAAYVEPADRVPDFQV